MLVEQGFFLFKISQLEAGIKVWLNNEFIIYGGERRPIS